RPPPLPALTAAPAAIKELLGIKELSGFTKAPRQAPSVASVPEEFLDRRGGRVRGGRSRPRRAQAGPLPRRGRRRAPRRRPGSPRRTRPPGRYAGRPAR